MPAADWTRKELQAFADLEARLLIRLEAAAGADPCELGRWLSQGVELLREMHSLYARALDDRGGREPRLTSNQIVDIERMTTLRAHLFRAGVVRIDDAARACMDKIVMRNGTYQALTESSATEPIHEFVARFLSQHPEYR